MESKKPTILIIFLFVFPFSSFSQNTETRGINLVVKNPTGKALAYYKNSYALVVGVGDYTAGWSDLPNAISDATNVGECLKKHGFQIESLFNPTKNELEGALEEFIFQHGQFEDTRLIFYFAGHGHSIFMPYGGKLGYIVPADAPLPVENQTEFMQRAISMREFDNHARQIQAKHVLYIFDSCFSGSIFALSRSAPEKINEKIKYHVRQFITAGREDEEVPDESIFTKQLITALDGDGDIIKDGYITGSELGLYLQENVPIYSNQHPQFGKIKDPDLARGDFVFAADFHIESIGDQEPPDIFDITEGRAIRGKSFPIRVKVQDNSEVSQVFVVYKNGVSSNPVKNEMVNVGDDIYEYEVPELGNQRFSYAVAAWDKVGNRKISKATNLNVIDANPFNISSTGRTTKQKKESHIPDKKKKASKKKLAILCSAAVIGGVIIYFMIKPPVPPPSPGSIHVEIPANP